VREKIERPKNFDEKKTLCFQFSPHQFDSGLPQTAALGRSAEMAKMRRLK
jgi:hypothetical protein